MTAPINTTFTTGTTITSEWLNGVNDYVNELDPADHSAANVTYDPPFTNAVATNVEDKLAQYVSVKDFGAVGDGITDDTTAFNNAISAANSATNGLSIYVPEGLYLIKSDTTTITSPTNWVGSGLFTSRIIFENCNGFKYDLSAFSLYFVASSISDLTLLTNTTGKTGIYFKGKQTFTPHDNQLTLNNVTLTSARYYDNTTSISAEWNIGVHLYDTDAVILNNLTIRGSDNNTNYSGLTTSTGVKVESCTALRILNSELTLMGTAFDVSGQSEAHNFYGCAFVAVGVGLYYHDLLDPSNNHFVTNTHIAAYTIGINFAELVNLPTSCYITNCFLLEREGNASKPYYKNIVLNCRYSAISGCTLQSNDTLTATRVGIYLLNEKNIVNNCTFYNGGQIFVVGDAGNGYYSQANNCVTVGSVASVVSGTSNYFMLNGQMSSDLLENRANTHAFTNLAQNNLLQTSAGGQLLLGNNTVDNWYIDFKSKTGGAAAYDARILSSGGDASTSGQAGVTYYGATHTFSGPVRAQTDNAFSCGSAGLRWTQVYAASGTINTSDERDKQDIRNLELAEKEVALKIKGLLKAFRFKDAVTKKGDGARIHFGVMAQQVVEAFESSGLDATKYALLCHDKWDAEEAVIDAKTGEILVPAVEEGERYGVRYEELLAFIIGAM